MDRPSWIDLTEEVVLSPDRLPEYMRSFRAYRIGYRDEHGYSSFEERIWLPPQVDPEKIERILTKGLDEMLPKLENPNQEKLF